MKRIVLAVSIGILFIAGGIYFFSNNRSQLRQTSQKGQFSKDTNFPEAKSSEVVTLKNGQSYNLTASIVSKVINGQKVKMLAYNDSIPGPLLKVPQGAEVTIHLKNNTDVPTALHSHGVRLDNQFDGVVDVTQKAIPVGGSFTYKVKFPDAGIFWYHPHLREDYAQESGLYGNYLVIPPKKDYWAEVDREEALFLDDILIENGKVASFSKEGADHTLMGRFGNVMLVNGSDNYLLNIKQGERVRFYVTNAANTRVFNFSIPNARMKLVGADNGKYEREEWVEAVTISPSERAVIEVWFDKGGNFQMVHKTPDKTYPLGTIAVQQQAVTTSYLLVPRTNQDVIDILNPLRSLFTKPADKRLTLTLQMGTSDMSGNENSMGGHMMGNGQMMGNSQMSMGEVQKIEWEDDMGMMNVESTTKTLKWKLVDLDTKRENVDINWRFRKGDIVKISIFNDDTSMHPMQHPIHIHGQKFLVLSTNGQRNQNLVWKDTALIQTEDTVELLVQMDNPGDWMIHCHIPEHMESGMMTLFKVV